MIRLFLSVALFLIGCSSFSQTQPGEDTKHVNLPAYLIELMQVSGKDSIVHVDSTYSFKITIPKWWRIRETPMSLFGGTFPAIESIENALVFKCFKKNEYKSIEDFENWVIKDYSMGQTPKWSNQHKILLKKKLTEFQDLGSAYKTQILRGGKIYDCCYIITQTSSAYIWIDFTATAETYSKNFPKFKEVVSLYEQF